MHPDEKTIDELTAELRAAISKEVTSTPPTVNEGLVSAQRVAHLCGALATLEQIPINKAYQQQAAGGKP
jgi:hypothetical protein